MSNEKSVLIGKITGAHGIRGIAKIHFFGDDITCLDGDVYTDEALSQEIEITIKNKNKNLYLAQVNNITDRNECEALKGTELYIAKEALAPAKEDEFYYNDLTGLDVYAPDGQELGKVIGVDNFGAGDIIEIKPLVGDSYYLPFSKTCVLEIKDDRIIVELPEIV